MALELQQTAATDKTESTRGPLASLQTDRMPYEITATKNINSNRSFQTIRLSTYSSEQKTFIA